MFAPPSPSQGALANGVALSLDGATLYINHYLSNQVVGIDRDAGRRLWTTPVDGAPDNMNVTPSGKLLVAFHRDSLRELRDQRLGKAISYCGRGFGVVHLDPESGNATSVLKSQGEPFGGATVAVEIGDSI